MQSAAGFVRFPPATAAQPYTPTAAGKAYLEGQPASLKQVVKTAIRGLKHA